MFTKKRLSKYSDDDIKSSPRSITLHTMEDKLWFAWRLFIATRVLDDEKEVKIIERRIQKKLKEIGKD